MSDEDKLFALVIALLAGGKVFHFDAVSSAKNILVQLKKETT